MWCSGCGIGTVLGCVFRALHRLGLGERNVVFSIGIGCSRFSSRYANFDVAQTTHGRALGVATGIKLANPKLKVLCLTGDGDCLGIGGNHFIHAARRNIGVTTILFNNRIYGMTGGQYSPTTSAGDQTATSPYGMLEGSFDACTLARAAGATYVARATTYHAHLLTDLIARAIEHPGFALAEALCQCPSQYSCINRKGASPAEMMREFQSACVRVKGPDEPVPEGKIPIGELYVARRPELSELYARQLAQASAHLERTSGEERQ